MQIDFLKVSDDSHEVTVRRDDGSSESVRLESRSFFYHDLAHLVVETQLPLWNGFWGSVAAGGPLAGPDQLLETNQIMTAERLAGPVQTLIKADASAAQYRTLFAALLGDDTPEGLADAVYQRVRELRGRWRATPRGESMSVSWPDLNVGSRRHARNSS